MNAIAFGLYTAALHLLIPVALLHLWWRGRRQPEYREHVAERFGGCLPAVTGPVLWIHAVSVGETRAARLSRYRYRSGADERATHRLLPRLPRG